MKDIIYEFLDYILLERKYSDFTETSYELDLFKYEEYLNDHKINYLKVNYNNISDIKKGDKNKANGGIGIVEYVYDEAGKYWVEQQEKNEKIILELERQIEIQRETWLSSPKKLVKTKKNKNKKFNLDEVENG